MEKLAKYKLSIFASIVFIIYAVWWVSFQPSVEEGGTTVEIFNNTYWVMALFGAVIGFWVSKKWGGVKAVLGRAIFMFALGLLAQVFGQVVYSYFFYVAGTEVPYPSLGDAGFFGSVIFYIYGTLLLAKAAGVKLSLKNFVNKIQAVLIPAALLIFSYAIFLRQYEIDPTAPLTTFLDFGYPLGQAFYISIALITYLLSRKFLGGIMKNKIVFLLLALFIQYLADYSFLYQIIHETWVPGAINDFTYLFAYFVMAIALLRFKHAYDELEGAK